MEFVTCTYADQGLMILEILNEAIANSTALYDYQPRTMENMQQWFQIKEAGRFPVIGAIDNGGQLLGFASYGTFRAWPAYKYSVEHSVYVHKDQRRKGIGQALMKQLIAVAQEQQYHTLVGGIDLTNSSSIALHKKLGFFHAGTIRQVGFKFDRWLDLAFYQLILDVPQNPIDG